MPTPKVSVPGLTGAEAEEAAHIELMLITLEYHIQQFEYAQSLYQHCEALHQAELSANGVLGDLKFMSWMTIAARDAVMNVYHFGKMLAAIHGRIGLCPTLFRYFDGNRMKEAKRLFRSSFPKDRQLRDAIAHSAELIENPARLKQNRGSGKVHREGMTAQFSNAFIINSVSSVGFVMTHRGEVLHFEMTDAKTVQLRQIENRVYAALSPIEAAFANRSEPGSPHA